MSNYTDGQLQLIGLDYVIEKQGWLREELAKRSIKLEWYRRRPPLSGR